MTPVTRNIALFSSADFSESYCIKQKSDGAPFDFTGCTGKAEIRVNASDAAAIATLTVTFPDAVNGKVMVTLPRATILALIAAGYKTAVWDLNVIDATSKSTMFLRGQVNIFTSATRVP